MRNTRDLVRPAHVCAAFQRDIPPAPPCGATCRQLVILRELNSHSTTSHRWPRKNPFTNPYTVAEVITEIVENPLSFVGTRKPCASWFYIFAVLLLTHVCYADFRLQCVDHWLPYYNTIDWSLKMAREGRGTPGCFLKSNRVLVIHIKPAGWWHVRGVGGWVTGRFRAQVCSRKKNTYQWRMLESISREHRSQRDAYVRSSSKKIIYINQQLCERLSCPTGCSRHICSCSTPGVNQLQRR